MQAQQTAERDQQNGAAMPIGEHFPSFGAGDGIETTMRRLFPGHRRDRLAGASLGSRLS